MEPQQQALLLNPPQAQPENKICQRFQHPHLEHTQSNTTKRSDETSITDIQRNIPRK